VGADGIVSRVRRSLGLDAKARRPARVGVRGHFKLAPGLPVPDRLEIFIGARHELYVAPLPDGELLVAALADGRALGGRARATLGEWIAADARLRDLLDGAEPLTDVAGRMPVAGRARAGWASGAVLLGDAASATDPLTAGGLAHALVTAGRLAGYVPRVLAQGDRWLRRFDQERRSLLRAPTMLTGALLAVVRRPPLARQTLRVMRATPRLMRRLLGVAAGI
jgi:2-polyprenyl-6-methoxyphenol hydroxylase-like FAD-dependent oxidoreductase